MTRAEPQRVRSSLHQRPIHVRTTIRRTHPNMAVTYVPPGKGSMGKGIQLVEASWKAVERATKQAVESGAPSVRSVRSVRLFVRCPSVLRSFVRSFVQSIYSFAVRPSVRPSVRPLVRSHQTAPTVAAKLCQEVVVQQVIPSPLLIDGRKVRSCIL